MSRTTSYARHQTIHPTLKHKISSIWDILGVDRVIIGPSRGIRHNRPVGSIKIQSDAPNAIRMIGYSDRGISEFYVISSDLDSVRDRIIDKFDLDA
jgi:hypothetical protein